MEFSFEEEKENFRNGLKDFLNILLSNLKTNDVLMDIPKEKYLEFIQKTLTVNKLEKDLTKKSFSNKKNKM